MKKWNDVGMADLIGKPFGRLTVIRELWWRFFPCGKKDLRVWCKCECGKEIDVFLSNLKSGHTKSCGCLQAERRSESHTTHGGYKNKEPLMGVWRNMLQRCSDPGAKHYSSYGGRGIRVLWKSYEEFRRDMLDAYSPGLTIERKDNDGHYCKENCCWATPQEQNLNTSRTRWVKFRGAAMPLKLWSRLFGIGYSTLAARLSRGWDAESAMTTPVRSHI